MSAPRADTTAAAAAEQRAQDPERLARLQADVRALAALDRRTTTLGERESAELIARRLEAIGADEIRLVPFRGHSTWAWPNIAHAGLGLTAAAMGGLSGGALALATLVSYEADYTARNQWLRHMLPAGRGTNVLARIPARGERKRVLVLVAHHDAAHCGWLWHPQALALNRWVARRSGSTPSYASPAYAALGCIASGRKRGRLAGAAVLALSIGLALQAAHSKTAPGANDNATGVAAVLELARSYAATPLREVEIRIVIPGGEEVGVAGMTGWLEHEGRQLDPRSTLVVGLDALGAGDPVVVARESWTAHYRKQELALVDEAADQAGLPRPRRVGFAVNTDPMVARHAGLAAISILSMRDGGIGRFHQPDDTPENVDWDSVIRCHGLARSVVDAWMRRAVARA